MRRGKTNAVCPPCLDALCCLGYAGRLWIHASLRAPGKWPGASDCWACWWRFWRLWAQCSAAVGSRATLSQSPGRWTPRPRPSSIPCRPCPRPRRRFYRPPRPRPRRPPTRARADHRPGPADRQRCRPGNADRGRLAAHAAYQPHAFRRRHIIGRRRAAGRASAHPLRRL